MGEEVRMSDYGNSSDNEEQARMVDWEVGLPGSLDLAPLSQGLIPPELALAFNIKPPPCRTLLDVNRASQNTLSSLRGQTSTTSNNFEGFTEINGGDGGVGDIVMVEDEEDEEEQSDARKVRRIDNNRTGISNDSNSNSADDDNNNYTTNNNNNNCFNNNSNNQLAKNLKRPRLVWTPQLHKRFVDVVGHLGIKNAVPKTIMQLMNVEGLSRENVASHLQKYRLYMKRMHVGGGELGEGDFSAGGGGGGPSSSDQLFTVPHEGGSGSSGANGHIGMSIPYGGPPMMPVPVMGTGGHYGGHGHMGMILQGYGNGFQSHGYHGHGQHQNHSFHQHLSHGMMQQRQRDWSGNYNGSYPHVASHDK